MMDPESRSTKPRLAQLVTTVLLSLSKLLTFAASFVSAIVAPALAIPSVSTIASQPFAMPSINLVSSAFALSLASGVLAQQCGNCQSYGIDFYSGGSFFQNSLSTDPFTAVQEFEGCANDTSHNVLVDPNGDQYECSMTPMTPDDTPETITCPLDKDQLYSGDWSLLIISNNGNCDPIDFERDFSLSVGPQQTTTVAPTLTISTVFTPVESDTVTSTQTITSTGKASTTTVPKLNFEPTLTIQPLPAITVVTKAILTLTSTSKIPNVVATATAQATASCALPQRRQRPDPVASVVATVLADLGLDIGIKGRDALPAPTARPRSAMTEFKRAIIEGRAVEPKVKARWIEERHEALALQKRAPDQPTITVTDANSAAVTVTQTSTVPTSTVIGTSTLVQTTVTTPTVTVSKGIAFGIATVTASQKTLTNTFFIPATTIMRTTTVDVTLTVTSTTTPAAMAASCSRQGGTLS
ncbi:hypothetical protein B0A55_05761 [Friedmanniomyces simplex]|uniref:Uncharacterized protein n=1 Tax=Friedmanniomyces simplex TaxID=329884 RepID=A0A4U0XIC9_9PEZI|nr:hypothetical protein B0A55_05761 [Friedmanniomyces simplex]